MGERTGPESGETALAAATAAIITARWQQLSTVTGQAPAPAVSGGNGHSNGNGTGGLFSGGISDWAPPASAPPPDPPSFVAVSPSGGLPPVPVTSAPPVSPAPPDSSAPRVVHGPGAMFGAAAAALWPPERPPEPAGSGLRPPEPAGSGLRPPEPAGSGLRPPEPAGSAIFSVVQPDPVQEVFDPPPAGDFAGPPEIRTQVPPGFERRTFASSGEPPPTPPAGDGWGLANAHDRPIGSESPPPALLGVVPPAGAQAAPPTLAPPEPAPWVDTGWVDFSGLAGRAEPEPAEALVGAGFAAVPAQTTFPALPRRVPRVPDVDFPLFDSDPGEPTPDPATEHHELNRIADYLRDEAPTPDPVERPDGVDLEAVLGAVRQVPEVRDAQLRWNAQAGHTLRIEFIDGVDESEVTRSVVRLLRSKLGLGAQHTTEEPTVDSLIRGRVSASSTRAAGRTSALGGGRPLPRPSSVDVQRLVVENVTVTRLGAEATVEVRLRSPRGTTVGEGRGPGVDAYLSRLAATAAAHAVDQALAADGRGRVFVEHVSVVPFGVVEVAVVVLLLAWDGVTEQLSGSAIVGDDPHQAVVRATLAALNRRLESLL